MWLAERGTPARRDPRRARPIGFAAVIAVALVVSGCQFRPLYGERTDASGAVRPGAATELAAISIDGADSRVEQVLRNELIFLFTGGGTPAPSRYRLRILTDQDQEALAVQREDEIPAAVTVTLRANFILEEIGSGRTLLTGTSFQTATYSFSTQRVANLRALRDAEDRAARAVAENITLRIAAYFDARAR